MTTFSEEEEWAYEQKFHKWMLRAAKQNHLQAIARMGDAYTHGHGTVKDHKRAVAYYHKASKRGHIGTQFFVGKAFIEGKGVAKNPVMAAKWLALATDIVRKEGTPKALETTPVRGGSPGGRAGGGGVLRCGRQRGRRCACAAAPP